MFQTAIDTIRSTHRTLSHLVSTLPGGEPVFEEPGTNLRLCGPENRSVSPAERAFREMLLKVVDRNVRVVNLCGE